MIRTAFCIITVIFGVSVAIAQESAIKERKT